MSPAGSAIEGCSRVLKIAVATVHSGAKGGAGGASVRYAADAQEIDEDLLGQPDSWRHVVVAAAATATPAAVGIGELQDRVHTVGRAW